jgi:hypothetical protein
MTYELDVWEGEGGALAPEPAWTDPNLAGLDHLPAEVRRAIYAADLAEHQGRLVVAPGGVTAEGYQGAEWRLNRHDTDAGGQCPYSGITVAEQGDRCPLGCQACGTVYDQGQPDVYREALEWAEEGRPAA